MGCFCFGIGNISRCTVNFARQEQSTLYRKQLFLHFCFFTRIDLLIEKGDHFMATLQKVINDISEINFCRVPDTIFLGGV